MTFVVTLLYPPSSTSSFDEEYYKTKHMPLVQRTWGSIGLNSWAVTKLDPSSGYIIQCILYFASEAQFKTAFESHSKEIMGDIQNYSTEKPTTFAGPLVAES